MTDELDVGALVAGVAFRAIVETGTVVQVGVLEDIVGAQQKPPAERKVLPISTTRQFFEQRARRSAH